MSKATSGGVNFTAEEADGLASVGMLAKCNSSGVIFSVGKVEVVDRYADCTGFKCPGCGQRHDDRQAWSGGPDARMGYRVLRSAPSQSGWHFEYSAALGNVTVGRD